MDVRLQDLLKWLGPTTGGLWHGGPNVLTVTRGVRASTAAWRPAPDRHTIWELVLHVAYWKYAVRRRLEGGETGSFPRTPSDFPAQPDPPTEEAWETDRALLKDEHYRFVRLVERFDAESLDDLNGQSGTWTCMDLLSGVVLHDTYHVGQIQLMKRLHSSLHP